MAEYLKVLGQAKPGATTLTALYTAPVGGSAVVSTLVIANQSATPTTYRISVAVAGAADTAKQYIAYDTSIGANEVTSYTLGLTLGAGDILRVYTTLATVSFSAFGAEYV
jgi:hypothetical protein